MLLFLILDARIFQDPDGLFFSHGLVSFQVFTFSPAFKKVVDRCVNPLSISLNPPLSLIVHRYNLDPYNLSSLLGEILIVSTLSEGCAIFFFPTEGGGMSEGCARCVHISFFQQRRRVCRRVDFFQPTEEGGMSV